MLDNKEKDDENDKQSKLLPEEEAVTSAMASPNGRVIIAYIMNLTNFTKDTTNIDPVQQNYYTHRRSVGVELFEIIQRVDPENIPNLLKEMKELEDGK